MSTVVEQIISKPQDAFVQARKIPYLILNANECLNSRMSERVSSIFCKLDMENAYDHVN